MLDSPSAGMVPSNPMDLLPPFPVGKLPPDYLARLLAQVPSNNPRLILGARVGEDAAVIEMPDRYLVAKSDPITFAAEKIGWYSVHINANDIAVLGARPLWFLATLLLPEGASPPAMVEEIFQDILAACKQLGVTLCGGHTEITHGLERPIVAGQMLGEVADKAKLLRKDSLKPGDVILLTQGVAIEGSAVIAREKHSKLSGKISADVLDRARKLLFDPGISVVRAAQAAAATGAVKAMHDPTEGGVLAGLLEMAMAARRGIAVYADHVPVLPETREMCSALTLDPLALLASGALLIGTPAEKAAEVIELLRAESIPATVVAEITPREQGCLVQRGNRTQKLEFPEQDELARLFGSDLQ